MSGFGITPVSTTNLLLNQFPVSAVAVPGTSSGNLTALEGGPASTDSNGNQTAPVSVYIKDGGDTTQGISTDAANANTVMGQLKQIKTNTASVTIGVLPALVAGSAVIGSTTIQATSGTALQADQSNTELKVSLYGKSTTAGDTALLVDALGQMTVEDFIQYHIMQGHGFRATTGLLSTGTGSNNFICMQAASNAVIKHFLFYSLIAANTNVTGEIRLYQASVATADSNLSTSLTAYNQQPKSATTSVLTTLAGSPAASTQTSGFQGNITSVNAAVAGQATQMLQNKSLVYFASGDTASVEVANKIPTTGNSASITFEWIEW